jgi:heat shock protein HslJ
MEENMNNKTLGIGLIIILIFVGFSGCNELTGTITLKDIKQHPNRYLNTEITVEGFYSTGMIVSKTTPNTEAEAMEILTTALTIENKDNTTTLFEGGKYRFTGILKEKTVFSQNTVYLEVAKIVAL